MRRFILRLTVIVSATAVLAAIVFLAELREELAADRETQLFYGELFGDFLDDYEGIAVVAHNAGNTLDMSAEAQAAGAPIVEIDVRSYRGTLYAAHSSPAPFVGQLTHRPISLAAAWSAASDAEGVKLDLKDSSRSLLFTLFAFLEARHDPDRTLIISSRSPSVLESVRENAPSAVRFLSIATATALAQLRDNEELMTAIDGVSVRLGSLTEEDVDWLKEQGLLVYTWVVNDLLDLNTLASWGVDGVTTDNLAIIELLSPPPDDDGDDGDSTVRQTSVR